MTDTYSQPDAPDPVLPDERILQLARRHATSVSRVTAVDETGGEARTYMCDHDLVLKTQRPHRLRPRTSLRKEAFILEQLAADNPGLPIPRVLGYGHEPDVEYVLMTRVPGVCLRQVTLTRPARIAVLERVGATLRRIHATDQATLNQSGLIPGDTTSAGLRSRLAGLFRQLIGEIGTDPRWTTRIDLPALAEHCLADLPSDTPPVTLHSNPGPEHCFIDPVTGRFTGLIDFGDAYRSHPALDVRSWRSVWDSRHMLAGYQAGGPLPQGFQHVWRSGLITSILRHAARDHHDPDGTARAIDNILDDDDGRR